MSKTAKAMLLSAAMLVTGSVIASQSTPDITVFASKDAQGSVWNSVADKAQYQVSYKVTINNNGKEAFTPGKNNKMCLFLFDSQGHQLMSNGIQLELLSPYKGGESRYGTVIFTSDNAALFDLPFVKLAMGEKCATADANPLRHER